MYTAYGLSCLRKNTDYKEYLFIANNCVKQIGIYEGGIGYFSWAMNGDIQLAWNVKLIAVFFKLRRDLLSSRKEPRTLERREL